MLRLAPTLTVALTLPVVRAWDPTAVGTAGAGMATTSATLDGHLNALLRAVDNTTVSWRGLGADAALAAVHRIDTTGNGTSTALISLSDVLTGAGTELTGARAAVLAAVEAALADGCTVTDDGTVTAPTVSTSGPAASGPDDARRQAGVDAGARTHADLISRALSAAATTDQVWAGKIRGAVAAVVDTATTVPQAGPLAGLSPSVRDILTGRGTLPTDPTALHTFWAGLTPQDKEALFAADPFLGNHDGIPATDRNHFNTRHLLVLQADATAAAANLEAHRPADVVDDTRGMVDWARAYDAARTSAAGFDALAAALGDGPNGNPPRYLLGVDNADKAIISTGNPDTARNVATMVPGTSATLTGIGGDVNRADAITRAAFHAGSPSTAVVTWYGYTAPPSIPEATEGHYAHDGAGALDRFQDGLRATHDGPPAHNTVLGHSYGTTLVGAAAQDGHHLNADDVVLVASPGAMAEHASDLSLTGVDPQTNGDHVFATKAQYDPVPLYAELGHFGVDPTQPSFGAHDFTSASGGEGPWYLAGWNFDAHSSYWEPGNPSLIGMGKIVAGHGAGVQ